MKYIILSKSIAQGRSGNDSGDLNKYFELGWESVGSRFDFISLYNQGLVDEKNVTAVTIEDRMFLYSKFFKNVISYDEFLSIKLTEEDTVEDWPETCHTTMKFQDQKNFINPQTKRYYRYHEDKNLIFNGFDLDGTIKPDYPFVTMCIRHRDHGYDRNSNINFYQHLVNELKEKYSIFVVGKGNEQFCEKNSITYVERLKDYVSLIKNPNCRALIAQSTGTALLAFTCADTDIYLIDHAGSSKINGIQAIWGGIPSQLCSKKIIPFYNQSLETSHTITKELLNG